MSCTLQELLGALDRKLKTAETNLKDTLDIADSCKKDIAEIRNTIKELVNIL